MNCRDVDRILDEHSVARLGASRRVELDAHLAACSACRRMVEAQTLLEADRFDGPRPGLFEAAIRRAVRETGRPGRPAVTDTRRWHTLAGLGAVAALVLVVVLGLTGLERNDAGPDSADALALPLSVRASSSIAPESPAPASIDSTAPLRFVEGRHYLRLDGQAGAAPAVAAGARISVLEFFMYLCHHCYQFEFRLGEWMSSDMPDRVTVTRVPVQWNPAATLHARAFYAAEQLGVADRMHISFFEEIHDRGDALASETALREFFARFGVAGDAFDAAFHSSAVDEQLEQANRLAARFSIDVTPTVVVDDTYLATPGTAGSYDELIDVVDWLVGQVGEACSIAAGDRPQPFRSCAGERVP